MAHDDHGHDHSHGGPLATSPRISRILRGVVLAVVVCTCAGILLWRPDDGLQLPDTVAAQGTRVNATVVGEREVACAGTDFGGTPIVCEEVLLEITSGENAGTTGSFEIFPQPGSPDFDPGDKLVVFEFELADGSRAHTFADYQRSRPLWILAALFVVAVLALSRFQGLRALLGLVVTAAVLFVYVFPALLDGRPALPVALVASAVIALSALYLTHGISDTTTVALLGTLGALLLTGLLAAAFTSAAQITGLATEDQVYLLVSAEGVDIRGLVLAGILLGSLGVLDDVTITQVSAVARLREANPAYRVRDLYASGVRIGRDHIASTVNTLVLAYAGAALPLLLFYSSTGISFSESVTTEVVAVEIIRTLVGSIGLIAAVPLTTVLAALVVTAGDRPRPAPAPTAPDEPDVAVDADPPAGEPGTGSSGRWDRFAPEADEF